MDIARFNALADFLDTLDQTHPEAFHMGHWIMDEHTGHLDTRSDDSIAAFGEAVAECGTEACIAGWLVILEKVELFEQTEELTIRDKDGRAIPEIAAELLDLTPAQANYIFHGSWLGSMSEDDVTPAEAATYLRQCAEDRDVYYVYVNVTDDDHVVVERMLVREGT